MKYFFCFLFITGSFITMSANADIREVRDNYVDMSSPVILFFTQHGCSQCDKPREQFPLLAKQFVDTTFAHVDISNTNNEQLKTDYDVKKTPLFIYVIGNNEQFRTDSIDELRQLLIKNQPAIPSEIDTQITTDVSHNALGFIGSFWCKIGDFFSTMLLNKLTEYF